MRTPWTYEVHQLSEGNSAIVYDCDGVRVGTDHLTEAEASLIAAAPELFDLLTRAQEELRLIHMKDTGATYDVTLRLEMSAALAKVQP